MVTAETPVDSPVNATSLVEPPESGSYEKPAAPEAGDAVVAHPAPPSYEGSQSKAFDDVVNSDVSLIGISTLLNRLKQSIASAKDFAALLRKRSNLEDDHAQGLRKLCRSSFDSIRHPDHRQGSYAQQYHELIKTQDRMAEHGIHFAHSLHQMHDEIIELTANSERGRKNWKQAGLSAEKRSQDAELLMEKSKLKYDSLAEDYDRARTGQGGKKFGLKGPKSAAQLEEDLQRKVQAADADYSGKVQAAKAQRQELVTAARPQAVRALQELIHECDSALTMQMQKFATINETFLLSSGLSVTPINSQIDGQGPPTKSLREVVSQINNERDLQYYVMSFATKVPARRSEIKYERHPTLAPQQQTPPPLATRQRQDSTSQPTPQTSTTQLPQQFRQSPTQAEPYSAQQPFPPKPGAQGYGHGSPVGAPADVDYAMRGSPQPILPPVPTSAPQLPMPQYGMTPQQQATPPPADATPFNGDLPPLSPVFGVGLDELYKRDRSAVPIVVYQCILAVDLYGLEVEGIYRLSGTASHVARIKSMFDHDASMVDFRNPEHFFHDVNSVAGALKQFLRDLPDPLMTHEQYTAFIEAARVEDEVVRRDSLHAVINSLPDPNYATLRALTLHLHRVQEHAQANRMNSGNLAICFGPTLMGSNAGQNITDAGWQVRVIDTILQNTYQIFDDD
ncbi:MAG: hypothetical protein M1815_000232 [Lichina confinis]|nr:MAG: hypothetical protein M1815_000232 [Lichina confinis]